MPIFTQRALEKIRGIHILDKMMCIGANTHASFCKKNLFIFFHQFICFLLSALGGGEWIITGEFITKRHIASIASKPEGLFFPSLMVVSTAASYSLTSLQKADCSNVKYHSWMK